MFVNEYLSYLEKQISANTIVTAIVIGILILYFIIDIIIKKNADKIKYVILAIIITIGFYSYNTIPIIKDYSTEDIISGYCTYNLIYTDGIDGGKWLVGGTVVVEFEDGSLETLKNTPKLEGGKHSGLIWYGKHSKVILDFIEE